MSKHMDEDFELDSQIKEIEEKEKLKGLVTMGIRGELDIPYLDVGSYKGQDNVPIFKGNYTNSKAVGVAKVFVENGSLQFDGTIEVERHVLDSIGVGFAWLPKKNELQYLHIEPKYIARMREKNKDD